MPDRLSTLLACALLALTSCAPGARNPDDRPNVLWITCEDLNPMLGAYGHPLAQTPRIDRMADEGVLFTQAFATAAVCAPPCNRFATGWLNRPKGNTWDMTCTATGRSGKRSTHFDESPDFSYFDYGMIHPLNLLLWHATLAGPSFEPAPSLGSPA